MHKALFLDFDNTIRFTKSKEITPKDADDIIYSKAIKKVLERYKKDGFLILGVTNQGGIETGHTTEKIVQDCIARTNALYGDIFDDVIYCPALDSVDRKPDIGMITMLTRKYQLSLAHSIMVGDRQTDLMCAVNSGIGYFYFAPEFFNHE